MGYHIMAGKLRLKGTSSGYVELSAPDSGPNVSINTGLLAYKDSANGTIQGLTTADVSESGDLLYYTDDKVDSVISSTFPHFVDSVGGDARIDADADLNLTAIDDIWLTAADDMRIRATTGRVFTQSTQETWIEADEAIEISALTQGTSTGIKLWVDYDNITDPVMELYAESDQGYFKFNGGPVLTGVIDDDTMSTASASTLATSESIKAYADTFVSLTGDETISGYKTFSGNVGVDTTESFQSGQKLAVGDGSSNSGMTVYSGTASQGRLYFASATTGAGQRAGQIYYDHSNNSMTVSTNGDNPRISVLQNGKVGIGTNAPNSLLSVSGNSQHRIEITATDTTMSNGADYGGLRWVTNDAANPDLTTWEMFQEANGTTGATELVWDYQGTEYMRVSGNGRLGIGETTPTQTLSVGGNFSLTDGSGSEVARVQHIAGTETRLSSTDHLVFRTGGVSSVSYDRMRIDSSGNVAIGTTSSTFRINVASAASTVGNFSSSTSETNIRLTNSGGLATIGSSGNEMKFTTSLTERMRITSTGFVGIGTSYPVEDLSIRSSSSQAGLSLAAATTQSFVRYNNYYAAGSAQVSDASKGSASLGLGKSSDGVITLYTAAAGAGAPTERMRIDAAGRVLINNTNTVGSLNLEVSAPSGFSVVSGFYSPSTQSTIDFKDSNTTANYKVRVGSEGDDLLMVAGGSERMRIDAAGNVGVGTSDPTDYLDVKPSGNDQRVIRISHPTAPTDACAFLGFVDTGTGTNTGVALGVQYSSAYYNAITIDRATRNVLIGAETAAPNPDALLHIHKNVNAGNVPFGDEASQVISTNANAAGVQGYLGSLFFGSQDVSSATQYAWRAAGIAGYMDVDIGTGGARGQLLFYTAYSSQTPTERMRIDEDGNVGIGISTPDEKLVVSGNLGFAYNNAISAYTIGKSADQYGLLYNSGVTSDITKVAHTFTSSANSNIMTMTYGGNVGIGASNPSAVISSSKILQLSSTGNTTLSVTSTDGVNDRNAILELLSSGNGNSKSIILYGDTDTTPSSESPLVIQRYHSGSRTEVGRFNTSGHLVLGDSTTAFFRLKSGANGTNGGMQWMFNTDATVYGSLTLPYDTRGTTGLHLYSGYPITHTVPANKAHQFVTGSTEAARIDADGIKFNGDTASSNGLNDYEEGTWTPSSGANISSISSVSGHYTKVGNLVTILFYATITPTSSASQIQITGLPFAVANKLAGSNVEGVGIAFEDSNMFVAFALGQSSEMWIELDRPIQGTADTTSRNYRGSITYMTT